MSYQQQVQRAKKPNDEDEEKEDEAWRDTNVGMIGSDLDRDTKKEAAKGEEAWEGAGKETGIQVWRINKFEVEKVPKKEHGEFFIGDSYIVLHTYKKDPNSQALDYDLFFWIGKNSTQDEYGTAAYKTVELDTLLDDKPVQHREVCGNESDKFIKCFGDIHRHKGGYESGFNKVTETVFKSKMYKIKGMKNNPNTFSFKEVDMKWEKIYVDSVVLLVTNDHIYQYNGPKAPHRHKYAMRQRIANLPILRIRGEIKCSTVEGIDDLFECFGKELGDPPADFDINRERPEEPEEQEEYMEIALYRYPDDDGCWELVAKGDQIPKFDNLDFEDNTLYLLDLNNECCMLEKRRNSVKKESSMVCGQKHLDNKKSRKKCRVPLSCTKDDKVFVEKCRK